MHLIVVVVFLQAAEPVKMRAPNKKFLLKRNTLILWGGVTIEHEMVRFLADAAVVRLAKDGSPLRFYAEGGVVVVDGQRIIFAEALWYDFIRERGRIKRADAWLPFTPSLRLRLSAEEVVTERGFRVITAKGGVVSDCTFGEPHWGFRSRHLRVDETGTVHARGNRLFLGPLPIPAPPLRIEREWWFPIRRLSFSHRTNFGSTTSLILRAWQGSAGFENSQLVVEGRYEHASLRGDGGGCHARLKARVKTTTIKAQTTYFEFHDSGAVHGLWNGPRNRRYADIQITFLRRASLTMVRHCDMSDSRILPDFFPHKNRTAEPQYSFFLSYLHSPSSFGRIFLQWQTFDFADTPIALPSLQSEVFNLNSGVCFLDMRVFWERRGIAWSYTSGYGEDMGERVGFGLRARRSFWVGPLILWVLCDGETAKYRRLYGFWDETDGLWGEGEVGVGTLLWRRFGERLLHTIRPQLLWRRRWASRGAEAANGFLNDWGESREHSLIAELRSSMNRDFGAWVRWRLDLKAEREYWRFHLEGRTVVVGVGLRGGCELRSGEGGWRKAWLQAGDEARISCSWQKFGGRNLLNLGFRVDVQGRWDLRVEWQYNLETEATSRMRFVVVRIFHCFFVEVGLDWDMEGDEKGIYVRFGPVSLRRRVKPLQAAGETE